MAKAPAFLEILAKHAETIDEVLGRLLADERIEGELTRPVRLMEAMRYSALGAGKRIRPFYMIETARLFMPVQPATLETAAALEMIHCYSLIHDDLPAMDNDDLRRGKATLHRAFDEATAILAGDALLTLAFDVLTDLVDVQDQTKLALIQKLARAAGLGGMVGGQMLDLQAESASTHLQRHEIELLQQMKTGALLHYSVEAAGILAGCSEEQKQLLSLFGRKIGVLFQISDDILDATGDEAKVGKKTGKDAARNKGTLVSVLGLKRAQDLCAELAEQAKNALKSLTCPGDKKVLFESVDFLVSRES